MVTWGNFLFENRPKPPQQTVEGGKLLTPPRRIMFGSFDPPVAAPPTQSKFDPRQTK